MRSARAPLVSPPTARRFRRRGQEVRVRHDSGHQPKFRGPSGTERQSQEKQLTGTEVSEPSRKRAGRPKLRHQAEIDEGQLELRALARVDEIAVRQHGGSAPDRRTVHGGDERLVEVDKRLHQARLGRLTGPWRALQEIHQIVARAERVSRAMPEHDRICSSFAAASRISARVTYIFEVIAFFFCGRFNWIRRMRPDRSVRISLNFHLPRLPLANAELAGWRR